LRGLLHSPCPAPLIIDETAPILLNGKMITVHFLPSKEAPHTFIIAVMRDVTEKITTAKELELLRRQQERILNAVGEGIFGLDRGNRITFANPAALAMLGYEPQALVGHGLQEIILSCKPEGEICRQDDCLLCATGRDGLVRKGNETFWRKNGTSFPVCYTSTPIQENQEILGAVVTFTDITARKKMEEKLRKSALTDELTGLFNRRGFMTLADKLIKISLRDKTDLLLVYLDCDNLKWINDSLGHTVGDQVLIETAALLRDTFRLADVIGRLGGDEFVILCTDNAAMGNEETILARLNENIEKINATASRQYQLSLSVGVTRYEHLSPCSLDELLHRADQMMYENKEEKKIGHQGAYSL
jgi:diguanylate cyclase (GGDEF)-like protein/PAS domain S-box-containing protein